MSDSEPKHGADSGALATTRSPAAPPEERRSGSGRYRLTPREKRIQRAGQRFIREKIVPVAIRQLERQAQGEQLARIVKELITADEELDLAWADFQAKPYEQDTTRRLFRAERRVTRLRKEVRAEEFVIRKAYENAMDRGGLSRGREIDVQRELAEALARATSSGMSIDLIERAVQAALSIGAGKVRAIDAEFASMAPDSGNGAAH